MSSSQKFGVSPARSEDTQNVAQAFEALGTDEKLALLYYVYEKMGGSITPAAPTAADPEIAPRLLGNFFEISGDEQLAVMRGIVNRDDTELSRAYGALSENNQLMVWYAWAKGMGDSVVDMPADYKASKALKDVLSQIEKLDFEGQISMLRQVAGNMGYSEIQPIPTQKETGKTPSL
ncbi:MULTISPECIES: orange carotenoid protein N-terminal domain-containing protein [unclassified Coleofasciculus]|uniref:orange carotenoid protein N-terminal domain-containing protein n=1 Tax=unclassified Coleofasciculus TaxID=2692782 RepID=UPI001880DB81|nr:MULTISPECIES: orange carotenoid protein N-terminal domain-containing protein [unclassified Coleofasciculus]MBE9129155.1 orange carotenoid protein [Coleofasciculus sp. LEGE 07081]MBE9151790.1 orange carotenoid protein [Coleofasciculus sp. LEGE 07092]